MSNRSQQIHDMIQTFETSLDPEQTAFRILDILDALNQRIDEIERDQKRTANIASCQANGIIPD